MSAVYREGVYVALGANLGDPRAQLRRALIELAELPGVALQAASDWVRSRAQGGPGGQADYWNGVAQLAYAGSARQLLGALLRLEERFGRERLRREQHGPRRLDLDLLFFGDLVRAEPKLCLPHPRLEKRLFVVRPLAQLTPELILPSGLTAKARALALELAGETLLEREPLRLDLRRLRAASPQRPRPASPGKGSRVHP